MNEESQSENTGQSPQQFGANHCWLLHLKNAPHLRGFDDSDPPFDNAKKDFYSGFFSALNFIKLATVVSDEQRKEIVGAIAREIAAMKNITPANLIPMLETLVNEVIGGLEDKAGRLDELVDDCKIELVKLAGGNPEEN